MGRTPTPVDPTAGPAEAGQSLAIVLVALALLATIPLAIVSSTMKQLPLTSQNIDYNAAFEAAQAGLNDYIEHLNSDQNYIVYSASNPPPDGNQAFASWVPVPGPPTNPSEYFRYSPDITTATQTGIVTLSISGKAGPVSSGLVRTFQVGLRREGFLDFIYFTDYETVDPASYGNQSAQAQAQCQFHMYDPNPVTGGTGPASPFCNNPEFITADVLHGPVHSNDGFNICGNPTFTASVTSSDPKAPRWVNDGCSSTPSFARAGDPAYQATMAIPPTDSTLKAQVTIGQAGAGCLYTGPTSVALHTNGTMDVTSPETKSTNVGCGPGNGLALPANGLIYVQNVPASSADPNYSASCVAANNPIANHSCSNGDAIVQNAASTGGLKGRLTIATDDDIIITGNLTYAGGLAGSDVLGLIADQFIEVNHPVSGSSNASTCGSGGGTGCDLSSPTIDAAMLTLGHSYQTDNYAIGSPLGTITVNGSIAQKFRGAVGTHSGGTIVSGYAKNYVYDPRLMYLSPPFYLSPVASAWHPLSFAEVKRAF